MFKVTSVMTISAKKYHSGFSAFLKYFISVYFSVIIVKCRKLGNLTVNMRMVIGVTDRAVRVLSSSLLFVEPYFTPTEVKRNIQLPIYAWRQTENVPIFTKAKWKA